MKNFISLLILFFSFISFSYAAEEELSEIVEVQEVQDTQLEEKACFKLLVDSIEKDARFSKKNPIDLSQLVIDDVTNTTADLTSYDKFLSNRVKNPKDNTYNFLARRNNIGTIITEDVYLTTQIVGFGKDSNFDFPLEAKSGKPFGDKYILGNGENGSFKEGLLYTHHLTNFSGEYKEESGKLLSCGIVRVTPKGGRGFGEISEQNYYTNILRTKGCVSGFEGRKLKEDGMDFYRMKVNVCANDYDNNPYVHMEVISIAYDNGSSYFNEYKTHPLQVKAMKNTRNSAKGLVATYEQFIKSVANLKLGIVGDIDQSTAIQDSQRSFLSYFIPQAQAKLDVSDIEPVEASTIVMYDELPYRLYEKLQAIPDEEFVSFIELALNPQLESFIKSRQENGIVLSPYEEIFMQCEMSYAERSEIVIDFLEKLDVENFDTNNLSYLNKKFGDCIVPYPDKENLGKKVENSFAEELQIDQVEIPASVQEYAKKLSALEQNYSEDIKKLETAFNNLEITVEELDEKKAILSQEFETAKEKIEIEFQETEKMNTNGDDENNKAVVQKTKSKNNLFFYGVVLGLVLLGALLVYLAYRFKNKK